MAHTTDIVANKTGEHPFRTSGHSVQPASQLAVIRFRDSQISISPALSVHLASSAARPPSPSWFSATFPNLKAQAPPPPPTTGIALLEPLNTRTRVGKVGDGGTPGSRAVSADGAGFREGPIWSGGERSLGAITILICSAGEESVRPNERRRRRPTSTTTSSSLLCFIFSGGNRGNRTNLFTLYTVNLPRISK